MKKVLMSAVVVVLAACGGGRNGGADSEYAEAAPADISALSLEISGSADACAAGFGLPPVLQIVPYPDTDAYYWLWSFVRDSSSGNVAFKVSGQFPYSRYLSYQSYAGTFVSGLTDYRVNPDGDSVNPFQPNMDRYATSRSYVTYFVPNGTHVGEPNTVQMPPVSSSTDYPSLVMRIFLPDDGAYVPAGSVAPSGWVPRPTIAAVSSTDLTSPVPCPAAAQVNDALVTMMQGSAPQQFPPPPENPISFYNTFSSQGAGGPNSDVAYLAARLTAPSSGSIALLTFVIPTFPNTYKDPLTPLSGTEQLRYVGVCVHDLVTTVTSGCARDDQLLGGRSNDGTAQARIVIGPDPIDNPALKAAADKRGYYYLSWKNIDHEILLLYRQVLPLDGWTGNAHAVPKYGDTGVPPYKWKAQYTLGAYAPVGRTCAASAFLAGTCGL